MVRHVPAQCHPEASVNEVASSALTLSAQHSAASTLVLEAGINNLKIQQSEVLKRDYVSFVDPLLDTGKWLIIAGPLPHLGMVTSRQLWLQGYCLTKSILFVDTFAVFLNVQHRH